MDDKKRLQWRLMTVFTLLNLFTLILTALSIIYLGVVRGLLVFFVTTSLAIFTIIKVYRSKLED